MYPLKIEPWPQPLAISTKPMVADIYIMSTGFFLPKVSKIEPIVIVGMNPTTVAMFYTRDWLLAKSFDVKVTL